MSDLIGKINGFSEFNVNNNTNSTALTTNAPATPAATKPIIQNTNNPSNNQNKLALIAGSTALAAVAATGIYLVMRGKSQKAKQLQQELEKQFQKTQKEFAKFQNGKAIANSGENFTGQISKNLKDGSKVIIDYENGILKSTQKFEGERKIYEKFYNYNCNGNGQGKLTEITKGSGVLSPKVVWRKSVNKKGFTVTSGTNGTAAVNKATNEMAVRKKTGDSKYIEKYFKDGKLRYERKVNSGNEELKLYKEDGKTVDSMIKDGKFIDSEGNSFRSLQGDCIKRPDGISSHYEYVVSWISDSEFAGGIQKTGKKIPRRYLEKADPQMGIIYTERRPNMPKDDLGHLSNQYEYKKEFGENDYIQVSFDFTKEFFKGTNKKRELDNIGVYIKSPVIRGFFAVFKENGKFLLKNDKKELVAVFNPKTKAFETLNMPEKEAEKILKFAQKASDQILKDRKDYLRAENKKNKIYNLLEYVKDIQRD